MDHTLTVVALVQALMAKLYLMHRRNTQWRNYSRSLIEENKWRAVRHGTDAKLIDFGRKEERPFSELIVELVDFVSESAEMLGTMDVVRRAIDIQREGTSAHRQIEVFDKTHDPKAVVDWLIAETMRGV